MPIKKIDDLLRGTKFIAGICNPDDENKPVIANGLIAATSNHEILQSINSIIKNNIDSFSTINNQLDIFTNTGPTFFTNEILKYIDNYPTDKIVIYPSTFFYPINYRKRNVINSRILKKYTFQETYFIHLWNVSWFENNSSFKSFVKNQIPLRYLKILLRLKNFINYNND